MSTETENNRLRALLADRDAEIGRLREALTAARNCVLSDVRGMEPPRTESNATAHARLLTSIDALLSPSPQGASEK